MKVFWDVVQSLDTSLLTFWNRVSFTSLRVKMAKENLG